MINLPIWLVVVAAASVALLMLISESKVDKDTIEKWVGISAPPDKKFCFKYAKKKYWGSREYLATKIVRLIKEEVEVENFDGSKTILPLQDLKQFQHPYQNISSLRIVPFNPEIEQGQTVEFSVEATKYHKKNQKFPIDKFTWTAAGGYFDGSKCFRQKYHATQQGRFTVRVSLGTFSAETKVIVKEPPRLHELLISPQNITLELDEERTLQLTAKDQYGHSFKVNHIEWTERTSIYQSYGVTAPVIIPSLSDNATSLKFQAKRPGNFLITAKSGGIEGKTTITVRETRRVSNIRIEPVRANLEIGQSQRFTVEAKDQYDEKINIKSINWRVSRGEIDQQGNFLAQESGQVTITAAIDNIEATASVTVKEPRRLDALLIQPQWAEMQVGQTQRFTVDGRDQFGRPINVESVEWQTSVGQIDRYGILRAIEPGICIVIAKSEAVCAQAQVTVNPVPQVFPGTLIDSKDPVTRSLFRAREIAYCCMRCKLGYHEETWEYLAQKCSNCESNQDAGVYRLPSEFLGKANEVSSSSKKDLGSLIGKSSDGDSSSLREALTNAAYSHNDDEEILWYFEYSQAQTWGAREVIATRVLSVSETEIQVEDQSGNIICLPIALLLAVATVPLAAKGAIIGGVVVWAILSYNAVKNTSDVDDFDCRRTVSDDYIYANDINQLCEKNGVKVVVRGQIQSIYRSPDTSICLFFAKDRRIGFQAYIPPSCAKNFSGLESLSGKEVFLLGEIRIFHHQRPQILLRERAQLQKVCDDKLVNL